MYNIFESPTIRIELNSNDSLIYLNNLQSIIGTRFANKIYFYGYDFDSRIVNDIVNLFPEKEFYIPINIDLKQKENLSHYVFIYLHDIRKYEKLFSNPVILNIDITEYIDADDIDYINKLVNKDSVLVIIQMVAGKIVKNLDFQRTLSSLELLDFDFYFDGLVKPLSIIREHPCNAYLCNGHNCHSSKSNFPRYLHVTNKGIYPYSAKIEEISMLKEIATQPVDFQEYLNHRYNYSLEHRLFIELNRQLFQEYVMNQMFEYLPWNIFMEKMFYEKY